MTNGNGCIAVVAAALAVALAGCPEQGVVCRDGQVACGEACVDAQADRRNCGACGLVCQADQICQAGGCLCPSDRAECFDSHGVCTDTQEDPVHCGACGNACATAEVCEAGQCKLTCAVAGNVACNGACVNPATSAQHCGACGNACGQAQSCHDGACGYDVVAACLTNGQVRGLQGGTFSVGPLQDLGAAPQSLAFYGAGVLLSVDADDDALYQAGYPALDERAASAAVGADPNHLLAEPPFVFVANSSAGTLQILKQVGEPDADGVVFTTVGELPFGENTYPQMMAKVGNTLYVTLYGGFSGAAIEAGQKVRAVDVSDPQNPLPGDTWELTGLTQPFTAGGESIPRPQGIVHHEGALYVAMNNLDSFYGVAGPGALAVLPLDGGMPSAIELPEATCRNPGFVRVAQGQLVVSCAGQSDFSMFPTVLTTHTGAVSVRDGEVKSALAIACEAGATPAECPAPSIARFDVVGGRVYLADQAAGRLYVAALDSETGAFTALRTHQAGGGPLDVCPVNATTGFSNVGDVLGARAP